LYISVCVCVCVCALGVLYTALTGYLWGHQFPRLFFLFFLSGEAFFWVTSMGAKSYKSPRSGWEEKG
jgi:hypothetical protein